MKTTVKNAVITYWLEKIRIEAKELPSLKYLKPEFCSLSRCHPILRTCVSCPWEVEKAEVQLKLLSGCYRLERITQHWIKSQNGSSDCTLSHCVGPHSHEGNTENFHLTCISLASAREKSFSFLNSYLEEHSFLSSLVESCMSDDSVQFLLDCSSMPQVIVSVQEQGDNVLHHLFKISRNFCFILHKRRQKLLEDQLVTPYKK